MKFSLKYFFMAFVPALVLFSVLMILICNHAFNKRVPVKTQDDALLEDISPTDVSIYYCENTWDGSLTCAVMVGLDRNTQKYFVLPVKGEQMVTYEGSMYYIDSLYRKKGTDIFCILFESMSGTAIGIEKVHNVRDFLPNDKKHEHKHMDDIIELIETSILDEKIESVQVDPVVTAHDTYELIEIFETRKLFDTK